MTETTENLVTCDNCTNTSESGWGDTPLCLDCEKPENICKVHDRTFEGECPLDHDDVDEGKMLVVAFITDGLTDEQINDLRAAVCAQGEAVQAQGFAQAVTRPDLHTFDVEVPFTVSTQEELHGILEVGAGL